MSEYEEEINRIAEEMRELKKHFISHQADFDTADSYEKAAKMSEFKYSVVATEGQFVSYERVQEDSVYFEVALFSRPDVVKFWEAMKVVETEKGLRS